MSADEVLVTAAAVFVGPLLWALWLFQMSRLPMLRRRSGIGVIAAALVACTILIFIVLKTSASYDVVESPAYLFMYVVLGLAWARLAEPTFRFAGLSARDDVVERGNRAAVPAVVGALLAVTLCYAGGNVGDGPGWWVVIFSAALSTGTLLVAWLTLTGTAPIVDAVTVDRDPAAGLRLGAFLVSCGVVLGRSVAGDWESAASTVADFAAWLPFVLLLFGAAKVFERLGRATPERPQPSLFAWGVVPSLVYLLLAIGTVILKEPPR